MNVKKVIIKNFRGYNGEHTFDVESNLTALVGKNDAGKSTLLEGLEIFFGDAKPELGDLNIHTDPSDRNMSFGIVFGELPTELTVDTSAKTTLADEYLLNQDGDFEVVINFSCTEKTVAKPETIIRAMHPTADGYGELLKMKIGDLQKKGKELGLEVEDKRVNSLWRKAIWESAANLEVRKIDLKIDDFDTKAKAIYTNLSALFPQYYIFKVDRQTTDGDSEAKDPMQLAVKEAQKEYQQDIATLQAKIQARVDEVAGRALVKLHEMDSGLAAELKPVLKSAPKWSFDYTIQDDRGVSLNKRGSGTRRLVLLNFFRAEAEKKSSATDGNIVYAIEEPETSQHPNNQKMVIDSLLELSEDAKRQVLITTHSPQLTEQLSSDSIRFIEFDNTAKNVVMHDGESALAKAADSLGILSNQKLGSAKAVILVEGETDETFLLHASKTLHKDGHITATLEDKGILILPVGSCSNVPFWIQKMRLKNLGLPYAVFLDSDRLNATDADTKNETFCKALAAAGETAFVTRKREIENYLDDSLTQVKVGDYDDAKKMIAAKHGMIRSPKKVTETFWPQMDSNLIIKTSKYTDSTGKEHCEIIDIMNDLLRIVS